MLLLFLLALASASASPTNAYQDYRRCLAGRREEPRPPGTPAESLAKRIEECATERQKALSYLVDLKMDGKEGLPYKVVAENQANLQLVRDELSFTWIWARSEFPLSTHDDWPGPSITIP